MADRLGHSGRGCSAFSDEMLGFIKVSQTVQTNPEIRPEPAVEQFQFFYEVEKVFVGGSVAETFSVSCLTFVVFVFSLVLRSFHMRPFHIFVPLRLQCVKINVPHKHTSNINTLKSPYTRKRHTGLHVCTHELKSLRSIELWEHLFSFFFFFFCAPPACQHELERRLLCLL